MKYYGYVTWDRFPIKPKEVVVWGCGETPEEAKEDGLLLIKREGVAAPESIPGGVISFSPELYSYMLPGPWEDMEKDKLVFKFNVMGELIGMELTEAANLECLEMEIDTAIVTGEYGVFDD